MLTRARPTLGTARRIWRVTTRRDKSSRPTGSDSSSILLTGACGQVGSELLPYLRDLYGASKVIGSDVRPAAPEVMEAGPFVSLDVTDADALEDIVKQHRVGTIIHMAALLSATGEKNPQLALQVNNQGVTNVLECARVHKLSVFSPSTIAVFGPTTPKANTPDNTNMRPTTMYGVTKVHLELLGEYYHSTFGVDFRSLRYPGVISSMAMPGGGTTDYSVEIFHAALAHGQYTCFLAEHTMLPMIYMPDLLRATVGLIEADPACLTQRTYNIGAISFTPEQLAASISARLPTFEISYEPDFRQAIADTWPRQLDDSIARRDWGWSHEFDLDAMTVDMLDRLGPVAKPEDSAEISSSVLEAAEQRKRMMTFLSEETSDKVQV